MHIAPCIETSISLPHTSIPTSLTNYPLTTSIQPSQLSLPLEESNTENMMCATNFDSNDINIISSSAASTCSRHPMCFMRKLPLIIVQWLVKQDQRLFFQFVTPSQLL